MVTHTFTTTIRRYDMFGDLIHTSDVEVEVLTEGGEWKINALRYLGDPYSRWIDEEDRQFADSVSGVDDLHIEEMLQMAIEEAA